MKSRRIDPLAFRGVMVSSTFTDLVEHRKALIKAIESNGFKAIDMENDAAKPVSVLTSSLEMVRAAAAYTGVISRKYGQVPDDPANNPRALSLVELEFEEALRQERPILMFVMGSEHLVREADVETDEAKKAKLNAFRERALALNVCKVFNDAQDFEVAAMQSVGDLRRRLDADSPPDLTQAEPAAEDDDGIPEPPELYAEPRYIVSTQFVGREPELQTLSDWATPADPHPMLLFEAIGGAGKSMLTWEWTKRHAANVRNDWAGRFWYSFYEKGAVMADFCRHALAYMTRRPVRELTKKKTPELSKLLLAELRGRPWLLVLDGLERILVAYHRFDAAQVRDEDAGTSDQIAHRNPCAAIRPEDEDLLRALASATPSKLLLTSRLVPRALLNPAGQAIPDVLHVRLPGLRPVDAERLLRSYRVRGTSDAIQDYLQRHCDCHPLVTTVIAGLINHYLPDRGNFDPWSNDPAAGATLNLAELDLVQKRNHILRAAIETLPEKSRALLSTLTLLFESVDYETLVALNPHATHGSGVGVTTATHDARDPRRLLQETVLDLESRGLLQYDWQSRRYDLHPVVRGVVIGELRMDERKRYGTPIVDYFSARPHDPYENAKTLDDVWDGINLISALIHMGRYRDAVYEYYDLKDALIYNLDADRVVLSILQPLFKQNWHTLAIELADREAAFLLNSVGIALNSIGAWDESLEVHTSSLWFSLKGMDLRDVVMAIMNAGTAYRQQNRIESAHRCVRIAVDLATTTRDDALLFLARLEMFAWLGLVGYVSEAEELWTVLSKMKRDDPRKILRAGLPEVVYAEFQLANGRSVERYVELAQELAERGKVRYVQRRAFAVRGSWYMTRGDWGQASNSLREAVRMAHEVEQIDSVSETQLALAESHLGGLPNPRANAEQLSMSQDPSDIDLAELWLAIGDHEEATKHALAAHRRAWADGEPHVRRYDLTRSLGLLRQLRITPPDLPPYDPAKDAKLPWEDAVVEAIEKSRAENTTEQPEE